MNHCTLRGSPWRQRLVEDVRDRLFTPPARVGARRAAGRSGRDGGGGGPIGVEVEFIPLREDDGTPAPIVDDDTGPGSMSFLARLAALRGWSIEPGPHGAPALRLPGDGTVAFEPGGQIEYATPPHADLDHLTADLDAVLPVLSRAAGEAGVRLVGAGIDPQNGLGRAALLLPGARYRSMHRYLSRIGDAGPRMMLQTAAIQVNVELDSAAASSSEAAGDTRPPTRWRVLNAAAPYLTAIFANSRRYGGRDTGYASYRARQWRLLDRRRTGLLGREADPAEEYTDFALEAGWIFAPGDGDSEPFSEHLLRGEVSLDDWRAHLTTVFPEIRPRGYLEIRCIDALPMEWAAVPAALIAGLVADGTALAEAAEIVGEPDSVLLGEAAKAGLRDPRLGRGAVDLFRVALRAAARTGRLGGEALERVRRYFEDYTAAGRAPGDEGVGAAA